MSEEEKKRLLQGAMVTMTVAITSIMFGDWASTRLTEGESNQLFDSLESSAANELALMLSAENQHYARPLASQAAAMFRNAVTTIRNG